MIRFRIMGGHFAPILRLLDAMRRPDLTPLAEAIRGIMVQSNRDDLLAGRDIHGRAVPDVLPATIRRGRGGDGPARVPRGESSRMIADYRVDLQPSTDRILLIGSWPGTPFVHFHAGGTSRMVSRDPVGLGPDGQERVAEALDAFCRTLVGAAP
jgi:hypothetical protein